MKRTQVIDGFLSPIGEQHVVAGTLAEFVPPGSMLLIRPAVHQQPQPDAFIPVTIPVRITITFDVGGENG